MSDLVAEFCAHHHEYNAITPARRLMQTRVLRQFEDQLPGALTDITAEQLRAYCGWLVGEQGLHPNTVRQYLSAIRPLIGWLWERRLISAEVVLELRAVKAPRGATAAGVPRPYERKEIARFWRELEDAYPWGHGGRERAEMFLKRFRRGSSKWNRVQDYARRLQIEAVIALALYGGLRRDEIFNARLDELHPDNEYIVVRSRKNRQGIEKVRAVPWTCDAMRDAVRAWLDFRESLDPPHEFPWLSLWGRHRLKPLRHRNFEMVLCKLGSGWEFHRMRHTAATVMVRSGMRLERVQKILGHASLQQTLAYAKIDNADVVDAAARAATYFSRAFARERAA